LSFVTTDSANADSTTWLTPLDFINQLGEFDLDPCAYPNHFTAKNLISLPQCGLKSDWFGRVWLNPPYGSEAKVWLEKLQNHGNGIALVFARLETKWIQKYIERGFFQIEGRISFISPRGQPSQNAGTGSILIPFGRKNIGSILSSDIKGKWYQ
jgi:hypothetical protein